jgi:hypothetical protein
MTLVEAAGVKYEDITLTCGTGMTVQFYDAIKAKRAGRPTHPPDQTIWWKSLSISSGDGVVP